MGINPNVNLWYTRVLLKQTELIMLSICKAVNAVFLGCVLTLLPLLGYPSPLIEDLNGTPISMDSLAGKWVFINYWASWCGPCVAEIKELNRFYAVNQDANNVALFAVNYEGLPVAEQRELTQQFHIHYPSLNLKSLSSIHLGNVEVVPVTYVFDPKGNLATTLYGGQTHRALQALVTNSIDAKS